MRGIEEGLSKEETTKAFTLHGKGVGYGLLVDDRIGGKRTLKLDERSEKKMAIF